MTHFLKWSFPEMTHFLKWFICWNDSISLWNDSFSQIIHSQAKHDSSICFTCDIACVCDMNRNMTHWYEWHDSFTCVTWLPHMCFMCDMTPIMTNWYEWHVSFNARHDSPICVSCVTWLATWLIDMIDETDSICDMPHPCVFHLWRDSQHDLLIRETWLIQMCEVTLPCVFHVWHDSRHESSIRVTWLIQYVTWLIYMRFICDMTRNMTRWYELHDSFNMWHDYLICVSCVTWLALYLGTWLIHMCDLAHICVSCVTWLTTWLIGTSDMTHSMRDMTPSYMAQERGIGWGTIAYHHQYLV